MKILALSLAILFAVSTAALAQDGWLRKVGDVSPVTQARTTDGRVIEFKDKVVVLQFWESWCPSCRRTMPHIDKYLWQNFKDRGLIVIAVGGGMSVEQVAAYQKQGGYTFPFASDPPKNLFRAFAQRSIPRTVLIGRDGKIKLLMLGAKGAIINEMIQIIDAELKRQPDEKKDLNAG